MQTVSVGIATTKGTEATYEYKQVCLPGHGLTVKLAGPKAPRGLLEGANDIPAKLNVWIFVTQLRPIVHPCIGAPVL